MRQRHGFGRICRGKDFRPCLGLEKFLAPCGCHFLAPGGAGWLQERERDCDAAHKASHDHKLGLRGTMLPR